MERLRPPSSFNFDDDNLPRAWKAWRKHFEFFLVATETDTKSEKVKTAMLLSCIGDQGREIYDTFTFASDDAANTLETVLKEIETYCTPKKNTTILRHKFLTCKQKEGQTFVSFVTELRRLSEGCEFDTIKDSLIKDIIIIGILDNKLRERMLREPNIDLPKAIQLGQADEETKKHSKELNDDHNVLKVNKDDHNVLKVNRFKDRSNFNKSPVVASFVSQCRFCSRSHARGKCPT